ncbi:GGDEF domain-containing protein [Dactylosporangium sp. CA-152071]|uniref:GGDEF domain-containing protein n=1 Tax=Dactylosporangium sp. CA-152071 TaxID=3239933 RepID=UPI003D8F68AC
MSTFRDLLDLIPRPGHRTRPLTYAICVLLLMLVMIALIDPYSTYGTVIMVVLAISQVLFIHVNAARRDRERDAREHALLAELAEANTDGVTGLRTRRFIYRHLDATPTDTAVTVAFCDADGLKAINTRLSHAAGDGYLAALAERLAHALLPDDLLVRLGGDEFAIATSQPPHQLAAALARALQHETALIAGEAMPVLASVGIFPTTGGDAHTALGCAEAAMRTAKQRRSCIEHYDPCRDGIPLPRGVRPAARPRDQQPQPADE